MIRLTTLTNYVNSGGRLVAMRPDAQLDGLLGISRPPLAPVTNGYLLVNQTGPGAGLQNVTLPFKGQADLLQPRRRHGRGRAVHRRGRCRPIVRRW